MARYVLIHHPDIALTDDMKAYLASHDAEAKADRWCPKDKLYMLDQSAFRQEPLPPEQLKELGWP